MWGWDLLVYMPMVFINIMRFTYFNIIRGYHLPIPCEVTLSSIIQDWYLLIPYKGILSSITAITYDFYK